MSRNYNVMQFKKKKTFQYIVNFSNSQTIKKKKILAPMQKKFELFIFYSIKALFGLFATSAKIISATPKISKSNNDLHSKNIKQSTCKKLL